MGTFLTKAETKIKLLLNSQHGMGVVEWVALMAAVAILMAAIVAAIKGGGGQIGGAVAAAIDRQIAMFEGEGGDGFGSPGGRPPGGVSPSGDGSWGIAPGISSSAGQPPAVLGQQTAAVQQPASSQQLSLWDRIKGIVIHPAYGAPPGGPAQIATPSSSGRAGLRARLGSFVTGLWGKATSFFSGLWGGLTGKGSRTFTQQGPVTQQGIQSRSVSGEPVEGSLVRAKKEVHPFFDEFDESKITQKFDRTNKHLALDVDTLERGEPGVKEGTLLKAGVEGKFVRWDDDPGPDGYGRYFEWKTNDGVYIRYAHLRDVKPRPDGGDWKEEDTVPLGYIVAEADGNPKLHENDPGFTGHSTGSHIHIEVWYYDEKGKKYIDPMEYFGLDRSKIP